MATKRVALKIAYIGTNFEGFQIQPEKHTIELEIFRALKNLDLIIDPKAAGYQAAGRTDKGVHAIGQIIAFNTSSPELSRPRIINTEMPDSIWAWARAEVPENFDPRRSAIRREYRFVLYDDGFNIKRIKSAARLFVGKHDFTNFSTRDKGKSAVRDVRYLKVKKQGNFLIFDIAASSFAWSMVRKIVTALRLIGCGKKNEDWIRLMLTPSRHREGLQSAPPHGLILKNVIYRGIRFEEDAYAKRKAHRKLKERFERCYVMGKMLEEMKDSMG